jgi:single-strand DNA-binding protein
MANLNINKCVLGGRLTADTELRYTQSGASVCSFTVAVNRKFDRETTDFINCVAWKKTAEFIAQYFRKGSSICVTGSIQVRTWEDNNGAKRYATELIVDDAYFVDSNNESNTASEELIPIDNDLGDLPF